MEGGYHYQRNRSRGPWCHQVCWYHGIMLEFPKKSKIEGMPIEDVAWGHEIYLNVKEKGIGQQLKVWDHHMS